VCIDSLFNRSSNTLSQHSATPKNNSEWSGMSEAHAIAKWHKSSNWMLNHHFHGDNEHAWKVEDGETRGTGIEDEENECDVVFDPRLCELIDLCGPI
jgi:hypothetical protein